MSLSSTYSVFQAERRKLLTGGRCVETLTYEVGNGPRTRRYSCASILWLFQARIYIYISGCDIYIRVVLQYYGCSKLESIFISVVVMST